MQYLHMSVMYFTSVWQNMNAMSSLACDAIHMSLRCKALHFHAMCFTSMQCASLCQAIVNSCSEFHIGDYVQKCYEGHDYYTDTSCGMTVWRVLQHTVETWIHKTVTKQCCELQLVFIAAAMTLHSYIDANAVVVEPAKPPPCARRRRRRRRCPRRCRRRCRCPRATWRSSPSSNGLGMPTPTRHAFDAAASPGRTQTNNDRACNHM